MVPTQPETGYGYIRTDPGRSDGKGRVQAVREFVEKPDYETAQRYVELRCLPLEQRHVPVFGGHLAAGDPAARPGHRQRRRPRRSTPRRPRAGSSQLQRDTFQRCRKESIDYAVMEKTGHAAVVPLSAGWSDVGSWASLLEVSDRDAQGNALTGDVWPWTARIPTSGPKAGWSPSRACDGCIVVETEGCRARRAQARAQDVKKIVEELERQGRPETRLGREVFRPWGSYDSLDGAAGFQVKRLTVLPGAVLSLQMHHRRAEHWVVVTGTARITRNDEVFDLAVGGTPSFHSVRSTASRTRAPSTLRIIEVQVGDYLGEDDIVRFEDRTAARAAPTDRTLPRARPMKSAPLNCFKAYDIRGRVPDELNEDVAARIGRAFAESGAVPARSWSGEDMRLSSPALADALARGLMAGGADVLRIGMCGTEEVYFATSPPGAPAAASWSLPATTRPTGTA